MRDFELVLSFPSGSVLIGGHSPAPEGVSVIHARLPDGRPVIPATALRGALRESFEGMLRALDEPACAGGNGEDPRRPRPMQEGSCQLNDGQPCRACRMFGGGRAQLPNDQRTFSALVLGEAVPSSEFIGWRTRHGVAIDRSRQSASHQRLFRRAVPEEGLTFRARGRLTVDDEKLRNDFEAAVIATTHIGAGKSGGLARVEMSLHWCEEKTHPQALPDGDELELELVLRAPASIGVPLALGNFRDTRSHVPGSALRGAIGFALAEILPDPSDKAFQDLVADDKKTAAIFDFLYPVDPDKGPGLAAPWPITARECQRNRDHGVIDTLLDRIAVATLKSPEDALRIEPQIRERCAEPGCNHVLKSPQGTRRAQGPPKTRIVTRVAMDRHRGSARDGALFSTAMIEQGTRFVGRIRNIPAEGREHLSLALSQPLSLGRGRAMGWGSVDIDRIASPIPMDSLQKRRENFEMALEKRLRRELQLDFDLAGRLLVFTLLSPLISPEQGGTSDAGDGRAVIAAELGDVAAGLEWLFMARRFDIERGWDQRKGPRRPVRAVKAGGVFVALLPKEILWDDVSGALHRMEAQGIGERTREGFGRVICFDPFICEGTRQREHG
ncbi:MAG: RAMP superfamily CRISPR-associated protein [Polyangiaceae bacterium]|nr:RAMP superfamily CRISPR-associated protein [Polyangiaceae bacterium]